MDYIVHRSDDYLEHHGTKGQKWGIRKYQNEDGSLTPEGREHYGYNQGWEARQQYKRGAIDKQQLREAKRAKGTIGKIDNVLSLGFGRRMREFENRHKTGLKAFNMATSVLAGAGLTAAAIMTGGGAAAPIIMAGAQAVGGILGTAINNKLRYDIINPAILKYGYNQTNKQTKQQLNSKVKNYVDS